MHVKIHNKKKKGEVDYRERRKKKCSHKDSIRAQEASSPKSDTGVRCQNRWIQGATGVFTQDPFVCVCVYLNEQKSQNGMYALRAKGSRQSTFSNVSGIAEAAGESDVWPVT